MDTFRIIWKYGTCFTSTVTNSYYVVEGLIHKLIEVLGALVADVDLELFHYLHG